VPGMGSSLQTTNHTVISAFESALLRQALFVVVVLGLLAVAWNILRAVQIRHAVAVGAGFRATLASRGTAEPAARHLLRVAFGAIWLFDGVLQAQTSMPLGLPSGVIQPAAAGSPGWVQHVVNFGITIWSNHPVPAAAAAVWIQVGIGLWLLVAPRGNWSRLAGLASVGWGLVVWVFGEAFGSIFSPGLTWLFGAPGGVVFYVAAGLLIALPERSWASPRLGRRILAVTGLFFVGMAVLQSWPGRGFWQGQATGHATAGTLTSMVRSMAGTPQPAVVKSIVSSFASFDAAHGWAVNLVAVMALAGIGAAFLTGKRRIVFPAVVAAVVLCLADWILIEDFGFLGGLGTDPNSMVPMGLIIVVGYVAMTKVPATAPVPSNEPPAEIAVGWRASVVARPAYVLRSLAAVGAIAITLLGAAPMALAATNPVADPILNEAIDGSPVASNAPAAPFDLVDQDGRSVTLQSMRGKVVALTFLDPVCTTDCPLIAQEFHDADHMLGAQSDRVEFVAVVANPVYTSVAVTRAFDAQEGLAGVRNWLYLTGSVAELDRTWAGYGVQAVAEPAGAMVAHSDIAFVIDPAGHTRYVLNADPGQGTTTLQSSFAGVLTAAIRHALTPS
jgi:cytochrome oxidase Cu insertion factor (SCO1/SenC/PrrC family)